MATRKKKPVKTAANRPSRLVLGETLDIDGINRLHARFVKCAAKKTNVTINAARVESADMSSLQALLALVERVRKDGNSVKWTSPSAALVRTAHLAGIGERLGLEPAKGD